MGEYGPGMTMGQAAELDKERVRHALAGELMCGEDGNGFVYEPAPKDECEAYILGVVDEWYFQAKQMADSGRAMERVAAANGFRFENHMREYMDEMARTSQEYGGYVFEHDLEELSEDVARIEGGW